MKKMLVFVIAFLALTSLPGCPILVTGNQLVVHNQKDYDLQFLSVIRVPDECSTQKPTGINLLAETIKPGESFTVKELPDGRYFCTTTGGHQGYVDLAGGVSADWYVGVNSAT
jgi:hypothetical protein